MSHVKKCPFVWLGVSLVVLAGGERLIQRSVCPCSSVTVVSSGWRAGTRWLCTWKTFRPRLSLFSAPFPVLLVPIGMEGSRAAPAPGFCEGTQCLPSQMVFSFLELYTLTPSSCFWLITVSLEPVVVELGQGFTPHALFGVSEPG